jgi:hypothetical protein
MPQGIAPLLRRVNGDLEAFEDMTLAHHVVHAAGSQVTILFVFVIVTLKYCFARHRRSVPTPFSTASTFASK